MTIVIKMGMNRENLRFTVRIGTFAIGPFRVSRVTDGAACDFCRRERVGCDRCGTVWFMLGSEYCNMGALCCVPRCIFPNRNPIDFFYSNSYTLGYEPIRTDFVEKENSSLPYCLVSAGAVTINKCARRQFLSLWRVLRLLQHRPGGTDPLRYGQTGDIDLKF